MSAPKSGPSTSKVKSKLSSKRMYYVLAGLSMNSAATTTTHHNVSDVVGVVHLYSSCSAKVLNAKQVTIKTLNKNQYPKFISDLGNAPSDVSISDMSKK